MKAFALTAALLLWSAAATYAQGPFTVVNYSGFNPGNPVAAGSTVSGYGVFTGVAVAAWDGTGSMPRELANTRVRVNNVEAPLYYVSSTQINFNIPVSIPNGRHRAEVLVGGNVVAAGNVVVWDAFPALATRNTDATRPGIILNQDNSINLTTPAARGSVIQLFATGCGPTNPPALDGTPSGAAAPTVLPVKAWVSVTEAVVQYAGAQPQFPGLCQVNIVIPNQPFITGPAVPLYITVNGIASNPVTVSVQ
jgi:uncharacterized protein (TIGR03437 family)